MTANESTLFSERSRLRGMTPCHIPHYYSVRVTSRTCGGVSYQKKSFSVESLNSPTLRKYFHAMETSGYCGIIYYLYRWRGVERVFVRYKLSYNFDNIIFFFYSAILATNIFFNSLSLRSSFLFDYKKNQCVKIR